jgi:hypothetical protein
MPRQAQVLYALEARTPDLAAFWRVLRRTTRQLRVDVTPAVESSVVAAAQAARPSLHSLAARAGDLDRELDDVIFELRLCGLLAKGP